MPMTRAEMFSDGNLAELAKASETDLRVRIGILRVVEAENAGDPRLDMEGGVRDQIRALGMALERKGGPSTGSGRASAPQLVNQPPAQVVGLKTLDLRGNEGG